MDGSGNVTASRKYDVYGAVRAHAGSGTSAHRFVGGLGHASEVETGLIYMRARYLDPTTGRFVSEDPAREGENWHWYSDNSPVNRVGPSGTTSALMTGAAALGVATAAIAVQTYQNGGHVMRSRAMRWAGISIAFFSVALGSIGELEAIKGAAFSVLFAGTGGWTGFLDAGIKSGAAGSRSYAAIAIMATVAYGFACVAALIVNDVDDYITNRTL